MCLSEDRMCPIPTLAPYVYAWGLGNPAYQTNDLGHIHQLGIKNVRLAFLTADDAQLHEIMAWKDSIKRHRNTINVTLSIGGANGVFPDPKASETVQAQRIYKVIVELGISTLDFDIEGLSLSNKECVLKLVAIIEILKRLSNNSIKFEFTLPVGFNGLQTEGLNLIRLLTKKNLEIHIVNCMVMDFYTELQLPSWSDQIISILNIINTSLMEIFQVPSAWDKVGVCPMIGQNDDNTTIVSVNDWSKILKFAKHVNMGLVSYWSINRDQMGLGSLAVFSNNQETNFIYTKEAVKIIGS